MADYGVKYTDAELKKLEKKINIVYKQASADINKKMKDFNAKYKIKEAKYAKDLANNKITQEQFDSWKKGQVFQGQQWKAKKEQLANTMLHANETAIKILNGQVTDIFAANANFMSYQLETGAGVNFGFGLYDSATVSNLLKNDPKLLKKVNGVKDTAWNRKKIARQITLGIIEGEDLNTIADRLGDALGIQNKNAMLTQARTSMTAAQNAGRELALGEAQELGINVQKQWMCTLDEHTRIWHQELDGQSVPLDEPFEIDDMKIRYPGDPEAAPEMIYNCRCTMVGDLQDYPATYDRYDNINGEPIKGMTYEDWAKAKAAGKDISPQPLTWKKFQEDNKSYQELFAGKKMSHMYNDIKAVDTTTANKFYKELQGMGKPPTVWGEYLNGTLNSADAKKLDALLEKYLKKSGDPKSVAKAAQAMKKAAKATAVPDAVDVLPSKFKTTEDWLKAAKSNPDISKMLEIEKEAFKNLTDAELKALRVYTGSAYEEMNAYLRYLGAGLSKADAKSKSYIGDKLIKEINHCKNAFTKATLDRDMVLRRGTDVGDLAGLFMKGDFAENKRALYNMTAEELNKKFKGQAGTYFGFTSTSSQWNSGFDGSVECVIYAPKGTKGSSIMGISRFGTSEGETLLDAGTKVVCEKIEKSDHHMGSNIRVFLRIIN